MPPALVVPADLLAAVVAHARATAPAECCGLLAGSPDGRVSLHFPIRNDLASPTAYLTNARDMLAASKAVRAAGAEVLAVYHSHPTSPPIPSAHDVAGNHWGETVVHLIVGLAAPDADVRAWRIGAGGYAAVEWRDGPPLTHLPRPEPFPPAPPVPPPSSAPPLPAG